uniref:SXP/RAL-2 family protein Ani s 5-like cation-binding domain-containing protein n=1 Tax=Caenorhabditis japonica TaxID=281687 RepID=A0A8R1I4V6_CAEJA
MLQFFRIRFVIILALMVTTVFKVINAEEDKIVGLEEFLTELDPNTSDIILELLEAQQLPANKANRMMRKIMRKLPPDTLEELFQIYKKTRDQK